MILVSDCDEVLRVDSIIWQKHVLKRIQEQEKRSKKWEGSGVLFYKNLLSRELMHSCKNSPMSQLPLSRHCLLSISLVLLHCRQFSSVGNVERETKPKT